MEYVKSPQHVWAGLRNQVCSFLCSQMYKRSHQIRKFKDYE